MTLFRMRPCPVDGCTQPHVPELERIYERSSMVLPIPLPDEKYFPELTAARIEAQMNADAAERGQLAREVHDRHAATHDPADYLATIHRLQMELAQVTGGIRPHMRRQVNPDTA